MPDTNRAKDKFDDAPDTGAGCGGSPGSARYLGNTNRLIQAVNLDQLETKRFEQSEESVHRGAVNEWAAQQRLPGRCLTVQRGERREQPIVKLAADANLIFPGALAHAR